MISRKKLLSALPYIFMLIGFGLSIASMLEICTSSCSEAHKYKFYLIDFGWVGMAVFATLGIARYFRQRRFARVCYIWVLAGAVGSETWFLIVQKVIIKQWCPICVSIAFAVFALSVFGVAEHFLGEELNHMRMNIRSSIKKAALSICGAVMCFGIAFIGVGKPGEAEAASNLWLGNLSSPVEVYIITDWFCPGCRKAEPEIEAATKAVMKSAKIGFIDYAIHKETMNFSPYNLSFQIYEKEKYLALRAALAALSLKTKSPTVNEVQAAIKHTGVIFKQMPMTEVMGGVAAYDAAIKNSGVTSTPTIIVRNGKTGKVIKKFEGHAKIKAADIIAAVKSAQ